MSYRKSPRITSLLPGILAAFLLLIALPSAAHADDDQWLISQYHLQTRVNADGQMATTIEFDFDFGDEAGHGPFLTFTQRQRIPDDSSRYRVITYSNIAVSSPSGAPADLQVTSRGNQLELRIGDPDIEVAGKQSYQIELLISGIVNPNVAGGEEIYWNVIGHDFEVPIQNIQVEVAAPELPQALTCFAGKPGSSQQCDSAQVLPDGASYTQRSLEPGEGLTVVGGYPAGTFPTAQMIFEERKTFISSFGGSARNWLVTAAASLLSVIGVGAFARRKRDYHSGGGVEAFLAQHGSAGAARQKLPELDLLPNQPTMRYHPPGGLPPAVLGTLIDKVAHDHDVLAMIVDLAVRGYLTIEEIPGKDGVKDWWLTPTQQPASDLTGYEAALYRGIFGKKLKRKRVSKLGNRYVSAVSQVKKDLYQAVTDGGWFVANPQKVRVAWWITGIVLILLGIGGAIALGLTLNATIFGIVPLVGGVAVLSFSGSAATYTPQGEQLAQEAGKFKQYLEAAVAPESGYRDDRVFNEYLPYAVAFGIAEEWATAFSQAYQGIPTESDWYSGYDTQAYAFWWLAFGSNSRSFGQATSSTTVAMASGSSGSSGSSGFSGGFSGGGVGGGGGGGW